MHEAYYHLVAMEQILLVAAYGKAYRENLPVLEITKLVWLRIWFDGDASA